MIQTISMLLWFGALVMSTIAIVDLIRRPADAFPAVDRQSKVMWSIFLAMAFLVILLFGINLLGIVGVIVTMFYLVDVRTRISEISN